MKELAYSAYRETAKSGDILLWEPDRFDFQGRAIADGTHGPYKHASIVERVFDRLLQAGFHLSQNGYMTPLSQEVRKHSGRIHVYRVKADSEARYATQAGAVNQLGGDYGIKNIWLIAFAHLLIGKLLLCLPVVKHWYAAAVRKASRRTVGGICSQYAHRVWRMYGHVVLCPGVDEALVSPNDLSRSKLVEPLGALVWKWPDRGRR